MKYLKESLLKLNKLIQTSVIYIGSDSISCNINPDSVIAKFIKAIANKIGDDALLIDALLVAVDSAYNDLKMEWVSNNGHFYNDPGARFEEDWEKILIGINTWLHIYLENPHLDDYSLIERLNLFLNESKYDSTVIYWRHIGKSLPLIKNIGLLRACTEKL